MNFGSLFSGIGGLDLGLERAGMRCVWQSEIDPYCNRVLAKHWPNVPNLGDVKLIDWSEIERPDLICGGYPCQPFSLAGTRTGTADPRHLWPYFADALRVLQPEWALLENVPGHLSLGFGDVLADLATLGYDTEWECVPAAAFGAPHLRWRLFVVAHANDRGGRKEPFGLIQRVNPTLIGDDGKTELLASGDEGGSWWASEPDVGRVADGVPARVDRLKYLGNAVVPQVAEWVGRRIMEAEAWREAKPSRHDQTNLETEGTR